MVIVDFEVQNTLKRARFFYESFLMADTSIKMIFSVLFLIFINANIGFLDRELI